MTAGVRGVPWATGEPGVVEPQRFEDLRLDRALEGVAGDRGDDRAQQLEVRVGVAGTLPGGRWVLRRKVGVEHAHPVEHVIEGVGEVALLDPVGEARPSGRCAQEVVGQPRGVRHEVAHGDRRAAVDRAEAVEASDKSGGRYALMPASRSTRPCSDSCMTTVAVYSLVTLA